MTVKPCPLVLRIAVETLNLLGSGLKSLGHLPWFRELDLAPENVAGRSAMSRRDFDLYDPEPLDDPGTHSTSGRFAPPMPDPADGTMMDSS
jgi:hypothetical protein